MSSSPKKRSKAVIIGSVGTLVAGLCAYGVFRDEDKTCVDRRTSRVIDDDLCEDGDRNSRWYYGGHSSGGKMKGGSYTRSGFGGKFGGGS